MTTCPACGANDQDNPATFDVRGSWAPAVSGEYAIVGAGTKAAVQRVLRLHCNACDWLSRPGHLEGADFKGAPLTTSDEVPAADPSA